MYITDSRKRQKARRRKRVFVTLALLGLVIFLVYRQDPSWMINPFEPTPTPTTSPAVYLLNAELAASEGRLADAIDSYKQYLALVPDDAAIWAAVARWQIWQGDEEDALVSAQKAVELNKADPLANAVYAWALDWNGRIDDAISAAVHAIDLNPSQAEARAYMAEIYADAGNWPRALEEGNEAVRLNPQSVDARRALGYVFNSQGQYEKAIEQYQEAIRINPNLPRLWSCVIPGMLLPAADTTHL